MLGVIYACVNFTLTDLSHDRMAWGHGTVDALRDVVLFTFDVFMYLFVVTFGENHARVCVWGVALFRLHPTTAAAVILAAFGPFGAVSARRVN